VTGIVPIGQLAPAPWVAGLPEVQVAPAAPGFAELLTSGVERVDDLQHNADNILQELALGGDVDLHGAMIALEQAEIGLRAMVSVRDKLMTAYEQLMNMAI